VASRTRGWLLLAAVRGSVHSAADCTALDINNECHPCTIVQYSTGFGDRVPTPALASEPRADEGERRACY
jgi:hypothetical protein